VGAPIETGAVRKQLSFFLHCHHWRKQRHLIENMRQYDQRAMPSLAGCKPQLLQAAINNKSMAASRD